MTLHTESASLGAWSSLGEPHVVLSLLAARPDWVVLDAQHGAFDGSSVRAALLASRHAPGRVPVWVRTPDGSPSTLGAVLDMGADGVIVPMVESAEQARAITAACMYPPQGSRSFGPSTLLSGEAITSMADANAAVAVSLMIETAAALEDVQRIAATDGAESLFVGPFDLAASLGTTVDALLADDAPDAPLPRVVEAAHTAGLRARGFAGGLERALRMRELGFDAVAGFTDTSLIQAGAAAAVAQWREAATKR
ncbi:HpcH/HpaI aldolase family protein [Demequina capsici]|uniref:Aldolase/citrate lyase family protein n=1 Tax=Demequina capsici TaxID=3075620 RepID=A0AA96F7C8_9MICO|nr:aldolase/citrate lyase family protein [Demequina sp. OYTSA14]WNM24503.1 aldolase/citrate lyase family protein [Demequina sp. OYTSA14]